MPLQADEIVSLLPGQSYVFKGKTVVLSRTGELQVGEVSSKQYVCFHSDGVASSYRCFAVLREQHEVHFFSGSGIGKGMLDKDQVLAAVR